MKLIIFITEGGELNASTTHRCVMVSRELKKYGYTSKILTRELLLNKIPNIFKQLSNWKKVLEEKPDIIVIQRSSNLIDYHMIKVANKTSKIIFDYDDSLFHVRFPGRIFSYSHLNKILMMSDAIFAGSHYLKGYARKFNENVFLIPTPVDTEMFHPVNKEYSTNQIIIGWLGSGTKYQLRYLRLLKEPLKILSEKYDIKFKIVSALAKEVREEFTNLEFEVDFGLDHWVPIEEISSMVYDFDIGVMPLLDEPFAQGKCAMKALEYMSMGIPVVASAVGENNYAIENGYNGFLASNDGEWVKYLEKLILDSALREKMGQNGRDFVMNKYSLISVVSNMMEIIEGLSDE